MHARIFTFVLHLMSILCDFPKSSKALKPVILPSRLYDKVFREQYGDQSEAMGDRLRQLASDREDTRVDVTDGDMIVAIVSPLMKRAHQLKEAGEQVFVDAGGNLDRSQARVFQFMAKTVCGGVPLGVVITNSEAQSTLEKGFALLRDMLPEGE